MKTVNTISALESTETVPFWDMSSFTEYDEDSKEDLFDKALSMGDLNLDVSAGMLAVYPQASLCVILDDASESEVELYDAWPYNRALETWEQPDMKIVISEGFS